MIWQRLKNVLCWIVNAHYRKRLRFVGKNVHLGWGVIIEHPDHISLGNSAYINDFCWLSIVKRGEEAERPELLVGEGTYIGRFTNIACVNRISIGRKVMIADRCYIGDGVHEYSLKEVPIIDQGMYSPGPIEIGDNSWIGINVAILPNVTIGRQCVIGANSVVNSDIPDYHIAAGVPARIIKKIEFENQ